MDSKKHSTNEGAVPEAPLSVSELEQRILQTGHEIVMWLMSCQQMSCLEFELHLLKQLFALGRLCMVLFLSMREAQWQAVHPTAIPGYRRQGPNGREVGTLFGKVRYWRTYLYQPGGGYYPLDVELGLSADGFSLLLQSYAARLATKMSYAQTVLVLTLFLGWAPAARSIENTVLGLGRHTQAWFAAVFAPENDGEVLVIQIDSKASPTATAAELEKRRGPRPVNPHPGSQRHRGRAARQRRGAKPRRKKGDKSKNGRLATLIVLYTLRASADGTLEGPLNKRVYASYAPKRHAVAIARREADKRGFDQESGKQVQIVTDGDNDLARYIAELFPEALHTIDVYHVTEYLWAAGHCLYPEGSAALDAWVQTQKTALYAGQAAEIVVELQRQIARLDPAETARQTRLQKISTYLQKRLPQLDYKSLREQDLELSSGAVEGAVRYVMAQRFDNAGMRWIRERAEPLLQLRCIEINGHWDTFISFVHDRTRVQALHQRRNLSLLATKPDSLPTFGLA